jgi:hypothetical protein
LVVSDGAKDARYGAANVTAGSGWDEGSHAGSATPCSANPKVRAFVRSIREQCAGISTCDPPKHWLADSLRAKWARARGEIDVLTLTPADDELVVREILKGTNT